MTRHYARRSTAGAWLVLRSGYLEAGNTHDFYAQKNSPSLRFKMNSTTLTSRFLVRTWPQKKKKGKHNNKHLNASGSGLDLAGQGTGKSSVCTAPLAAPCPKRYKREAVPNGAKENNFAESLQGETGCEAIPEGGAFSSHHAGRHSAVVASWHVLGALDAEAKS